MRTPRLPFAVAFAFGALLGAGCASKVASTESYLCQPACPVGTTCTAGGCVVDAPLDLAVGGGIDSGGGDPCGGRCGGATPKCGAGGACVACLVDADCPLGNVCKIFGAGVACVAGCQDDSRCPGGTTCCGGQCANTQTDVDNCGGCEVACSADHAGSSCVGGACALGDCDSGYSDCDKQADNGCEVNSAIDPSNCGACGSTCKADHGLAACGGGCYLRSCEFGWDDCDAKYENGCETSVLSDARNCGGCGNACAGKPNSQMTCVNAACAIKSCNLGFYDCDGRVDNGCEINGNNDVKNCGGCGVACAMGLICKGAGCTCPQCNIPNASSKCANNVCTLDKCNPGFADCDDNQVNGCEVSTFTDAQNCGACGNVCPPNAKVCINGQCTNSPCIGNPKWQPVTCMTGDWVWSRDNVKAKTVMDAAAARVLATGCMHGAPQPDLGKGVCSLDGKGYVSTDTFTMQGCNNSWWHIGGRFSGQCGGHDGDTWRHLVLTENDCYDY